MTALYPNATAEEAREIEGIRTGDTNAAYRRAVLGGPSEISPRAKAALLRGTLTYTADTLEDLADATDLGYIALRLGIVTRQLREALREDEQPGFAATLAEGLDAKWNAMMFEPCGQCGVTLHDWCCANCGHDSRSES